MNIDDDILMAYADGELEAAQRADVEAAIARDPALAARVQEHRALREQLQRAFDPVLQEPMPERLTDAVSAPVGGKGTVIDLAEAQQRRTAKPASRWSAPQWAAIAASLLVGLLLGRAGMDAGETVATRHGAWVATGELATALNERPSGDEGGATHIGFSFRTATGTYCRTFTRTDAQAVAGVACRIDDEWQLHAMTEIARESSNYRMAASSLPPAVRAAVEEAMHGDPLSAEEEGAALASRWNITKP